MKIIVIGDIHGEQTWWKIVTDPSVDISKDKIVFVGDYFDSFNLSTEEIHSNFHEIVKFKEEHSDNVTLILGNHDFHYTGLSTRHCSGFRHQTMHEMNSLLKALVYDNTLEIVKVIDGIIFSHAGISTTWANDASLDLNDIERSAKEIMLKTPSMYVFRGGYYAAPYGNDVFQSPLWIRPDSLLKDKLKGYRQVVGHTNMGRSVKIDEGVAFVDALPKEYLVIENNEFIIKKI